MYLHLGQDVVVRSRDIVGIFDIENTSVSKITKEYLTNQEKKHRVINVSSELPKSFIVCSEGEKEEKVVTVYISQISCATLKKEAVMWINWVLPSFWYYLKKHPETGCFLCAKIP